jgi:hypothetical protein
VSGTLTLARTFIIKESDLLSTDVEAGQVSSHTLSRVSAGTTTSVNLYPYIAQHLSHGSNVSPPEGLTSILRPHHTRHERDDTLGSLRNLEEDEGVLVNVRFSELVRVKAVLLNAGVEEERPRRVRVWANRQDGLDWDEVDEVQPDGEWEPLAGEREAVEYPLRVARFANVSSVTLHFVSFLSMSMCTLSVCVPSDYG